MNTKRGIWVVGASRGIGRAIADSLENEALEGRPVLPIARTYERDFADPQLRAELLREHGAPHAWVHTPGDFFEKPLLETRDSDWEQLFESNLWSFLRPARELLPAMAAAGGGRVIVFGAAGLSLGTAKLRGSAYFAVKAALLSACKSLALEFGKQGVTVNMISPGIVVHEHSHQASQKRLAPRVPLGRSSVPEDLLGVVRMLLGPGGAYLTGDEITVDGGLSLGYGHA
jgi:NAD(P)-dependent dehydrogenase (short-subunit alcohol dehydrogenase family)